MVARNFPAALREILRHEGGYVDHPSDPGGATNLGITLGTARENGLDVDGDGDVDKDDVRKLTPKMAGKVYRARYWNTCHCDDLPAGVDLMVFDFAVNSGPARARRLLQETVGVKADGIIGPKTMAAVAKIRPQDIVENMRVSRAAFYRSLETYPTFGRGWMRRLAGVYARSMQWAGGL